MSTQQQQQQQQQEASITSTYNMYCNPSGARRLSASFEPGKYDVLCARGKKAHNSEGNRRFRALVKLYQERYAACTCKVEKSKIVSHIVNMVRHASPQGGFVKIIDGTYWEAGDRAAKEKVGQTFRDLLHTKYSSSTKAKARARKEQQTTTKAKKIALSEQQQEMPPLSSVATTMPQQQQPQQQMMWTSDNSSVSIVSDDSFSNHSNEDNDDQFDLSPIPTMNNKLMLEAADILLQQQDSEDNMLRSSIHSIDPIQAMRSIKRDSLLRSSIHTIDHMPLMRSSIHSFVVAPALESVPSCTPLPFLEGSIINIDTNNTTPPMMSAMEQDFANTANMELDLEDIDMEGTVGLLDEQTTSV